jgi:hypothetical protein
MCIKLHIILFLIIFLLLPVNGQRIIDTEKYLDNHQVLEAKVENGDTILVDNIDQIVVFSEYTFNNKRDYRKYRKLVRDVKKVLPYAKLAKEILKEMNKKFVTLETEKEKKQYIKKVEERLKEEFEGELRDLTMKQGFLLMKLIDRETGDTSYELIKEMKGSISAFFWQTIAKLFGSDLKAEYDPDGEDKLIEEIVKRVEAGQL